MTNLVLNTPKRVLPRCKIAMAVSILLFPALITAANARGMVLRKSRFMPDTINVKRLGAKGDGIQNDSAAFQNAVKSASDQKKVLLVPKGTYLLSNIIVYPDCAIAGQGSSTILKLTNGTGSNRQILKLTGISQNVRLKNIGFDANGRGNSGKNIFCVKSDMKPTEKINNLVIERCSFTDSKDYGALFLIAPSGHITHVVVSDCKFYDTGSAAVSIRGINGLTFINNTVLNWDVRDKQHPAISFQSDVCSNVLFSKNHLKNKDAAYFAVEVAGTCLNHGKFSDNVFDGNGYNASGISGMYSNCLFINNRHINGGGNHRSGYELVGDNDTITKNVIVNGAVSLGAGTPGLAFAKGASYIFTDNKVTGNFGANNFCLTVGGYDTVKSAFIEHNIFDNRLGKGSAPVIQIGERGPSTNVTIENNTLYGSPGNACIRMKVKTGSPYSENIKIHKNTLVGENGIQVDDMDTWKKVEISENDFKGVSKSIFVKTKDFSPDFQITKNKTP